VTTNVELPATIEFFFDPACPWTWMTSRWLVDAAAAHGTAVTWRSLSLGVLNAGREIPEAFRVNMEAAKLAHRAFAALRARGRNDLVGAAYTEYGRRVHHDRSRPDAELVRQVLLDAGAGEATDAIDDASWDPAVEASTREAVDLVGPDVGSPVLAFDEPRRAFFGPIVSPPPEGDAAARLLELVVATARVAGFYELKRGRSAPA
jgi:hypothetical protein